eukprot:42290-Eustigmatos_ZCMA.PRE.1
MVHLWMHVQKALNSSAIAYVVLKDDTLTSPRTVCVIVARTSLLQPRRRQPQGPGVGVIGGWSGRSRGGNSVRGQ